MQRAPSGIGVTSEQMNPTRRFYVGGLDSRHLLCHDKVQLVDMLHAFSDLAFRFVLHLATRRLINSPLRACAHSSLSQHPDSPVRLHFPRHLQQNIEMYLLEKITCGGQRCSNCLLNGIGRIRGFLHAAPIIAFTAHEAFAT